jgi:hypothetical protein
MPTNFAKDADKKLLGFAAEAARIGADVEINSVEKSEGYSKSYERTITISWQTHNSDGRHLS